MNRGTGKPRHGRIALILALTGLAAMPASVEAVTTQGANGRIAFTSGRNGLTNANSQIYIITGPLGTVTRFTNEINADTIHHRHATWSPDRTKIAYAAGNGFAGPWDIWVQNVDGTGRTNITASSPSSEDRPSWSPDGTKIAYQKDTGAGTDVIIAQRPATGGTEVPVTNTVQAAAGAGTFFPRPTWSHDSTQIFYARNVGGASLHDIFRSAAAGGDLAGTGVVTGNTDDYHPAVSPDGTRLCFTQQGANKDIFTSTIAGTSPVALGSGSGDEYECAWSPDMTKIAFVRGAQDAGELLMRSFPAAGTITTVTDVAMTFDGNPEWSANAPPTCTDGSVTVGFNTFVSIPLNCADGGPDEEQTGVSEEIVTNPANGNLGSLQPGDPSTVIYTPNLNFSGTDSLTFKGNDGTSDSAPATVNITVNPAGGGGGGGGGADIRAAIISSAAATPARWRLGSLLPRFSLAPKGTTIRWRLDEAARTTLTFAKAANGRRVGSRCVRPTRANRNRRRCTRYLTKGALSFRGKVGVNRVRFQGKLTRTRTLTLGRYRLRVGAVDAAGNRSVTRTTFFTIVRR